MADALPVRRGRVLLGATPLADLMPSDLLDPGLVGTFAHRPSRGRRLSVLLVGGAPRPRPAGRSPRGRAGSTDSALATARGGRREEEHSEPHAGAERDERSDGVQMVGARPGGLDLAAGQGPEG